MYYIIYKITNKLNGKIYIGAHKTSKLDDGYMGSGTYLINAQDKYGIENFEKEILEVFDNPEAMFEMESKLVNADFILRDDTYNLKEGGLGGFALTHEQRVLGGTNAITKVNRRVHEKRKTDPDFDMKYRDTCSRAFKGKKHSDEAKQKIGMANSDYQKGEGNSQYGTMWIYSLEEKQSKKIATEDFPKWEAKGWLKGRKMKFL